MKLSKEELRNKRGSIVLNDEVVEAINDYLEPTKFLFDEKNNTDHPMFISKRKYYDRLDTDNLELSLVKALSPETFKFAFTFKQVSSVEKEVKLIDTLKMLDNMLNISNKESKLFCTIEEVLRYLVYNDVSEILLTEETPTFEKVKCKLKAYDKSTLVKRFYKHLIEE